MVSTVDIGLIQAIEDPQNPAAVSNTERTTVRRPSPSHVESGGRPAPGGAMNHDDVAELALLDQVHADFRSMAQHIQGHVQQDLNAGMSTVRAVQRLGRDLTGSNYSRDMLAFLASVALVQLAQR